jgi:hypothetical protein
MFDWKERLSTVDLFIRIGSFVRKKKYIVSVQKVADMNKLVQAGQPYWSFLFSKASLSHGLPVLVTVEDTTQIVQGAWKLMEENLKLVWAKFSTIS